MNPLSLPLHNFAQHILDLPNKERSIIFFYRWSELTQKPIPERRNGQTNSEYVRDSWRYLRGAAREFLSKSTISS